ncbi:MAG: hypothetical protein ACTSSJ_00665 [Candidatus Odinarchaeia archaeon]
METAETKRSVTKVKCPLCNAEIKIEIEKNYLTHVKRFPFPYTVVHGNPIHAVTIYLDQELSVRGIDTSEIAIIEDTSNVEPDIEINKDTIPIIKRVDKKLEINIEDLFILKEINGKLSLEQISKKTGAPLTQVIEFVKRLVNEGVLVPALDEEIVNLKYQRVYELVPPYTVNNVIEKAAPGRSEAVCTILANLDKDYTVLQISRGLEKIGIHKSPKEVLEILEYYAMPGRDVVRVKYVGVPPPEEWKKKEYLQVPQFAEGVSFDEVLDRAPISDYLHYIIIKNIGNFSILELTTGLIALGFKVTPDQVKEIIEEYRQQGLLV